MDAVRINSDTEPEDDTKDQISILSIQYPITFVILGAAFHRTNGQAYYRFEVEFRQIVEITIIVFRPNDNGNEHTVGLIQ